MTASFAENLWAGLFFFVLDCLLIAMLLPYLLQRWEDNKWRDTRVGLINLMHGELLHDCSAFCSTFADFGEVDLGLTAKKALSDRHALGALLKDSASTNRSAILGLTPSFDATVAKEYLAYVQHSDRFMRDLLPQKGAFPDDCPFDIAKEIRNREAAILRLAKYLRYELRDGFGEVQQAIAVAAILSERFDAPPLKEEHLCKADDSCL